MILGIGVDVVAVPGFVEQLGRPGTAFPRVFTPGERRDCARGGTGSAEAGTAAGGREGREALPTSGKGLGERRQGERFAARWAAKEAFVKAWSEALYGRPPVLTEEYMARTGMREIEVVRDAWGRPGLRLRGEVAAAVRESLGDVRTHVSLTHDGDVAAAYVVIEFGG